MHEIRVPRLGWSMEQGVFVHWLKQPGDAVRAGDALFVLEGEKATQEIEALEAGVLHLAADAPQPGATVLVGAVLGFLLGAGESLPTAAASTVAASSSAPSGSAATPAHAALSNAASSAYANPPAPIPAQLASSSNDSVVAGPPSARRKARQLRSTSSPADAVLAESPVSRDGASRRPGQAAATSVPARNAAGLPPISPRAVRTARRCNIDWSKLAGTGAGGRIREQDIRRAAAAAEASQAGTPPLEPGDEVVVFSAVRRVGAQRLEQSWRQTVPVTLTSQADASELVRLRGSFRAAGVEPVPSFTDLVACLAVRVLREHRLLNATWAGEELISHRETHLALAVDTPAGLLAPVIRQASQLSLPQFCRQARDLIERARAQRLSAGELQGGTFTLTNLGTWGIDAFTPILNYPQVAILGVGAVREEAVVQDGAVVPGHRLTLSLTFDHRALDGAPAAACLQSVARAIAAPAPILLWE